jgi:thermostable 8-oxoguanine DNA glycosylase
MQTMYAVLGGALRRLHLPAPDEHVLPSIPWGRFDHLLTPAYWRGQAWQHEYLGTYSNVRLGLSLAEELSACLLGGFGMRAELGLSAFARLRNRGLLDTTPSVRILEEALLEPFLIKDRFCRYRFPRQKARYLAACLGKLAEFDEPSDDRNFRDQLAGLRGIGLKTASWIVRNHRASNAVAIIDIHILRAGRQIGIFSPADEPQRHYRKLEEEFLRFAKALGTSAALLDSLVWDYMRRLSTGALRIMRKSNSAIRPIRPQQIEFPSPVFVKSPRSALSKRGCLSKTTAMPS